MIRNATEAFRALVAARGSSRRAAALGLFDEVVVRKTSSTTSTAAFSGLLALVACVPFPAAQPDSGTGTTSTPDSLPTASTGATTVTETTTDTTVGTGPDTTSYPTSEAMTSDTIEPICGDGTVEGPETCDDGNSDNTDDCLDTCVPASCGDGFVQQGIEGCDDANTDNTDDCLDTCVPASCGDGFVQNGVESCDDANDNDNDDCLVSCESASCGDGFVHFGVEQCDVSGENQYCSSETCQKISLIVFVSSEKTNGRIEYDGLTGIVAADAWCSDLATTFTTDVQSGGGYDDGGASWPYRAWLSSSIFDEDPYRTPSMQFPSLTNESYADLAYVRRNGSTVAKNRSALLTTDPDESPMLTRPIKINEYANDVPLGSLVWTNTATTGESSSPFPPCGPPSWSSNSEQNNAGIGAAGSKGIDWTDIGDRLCDQKHHFYCFEQPPEND